MVYNHVFPFVINDIKINKTQALEQIKEHTQEKDILYIKSLARVLNLSKTYGISACINPSQPGDF